MRDHEQQLQQIIPEFIATNNLAGLRNASRKLIKVQPETRDALNELADQETIRPEEAARWAIEIGLAVLKQAGMLEEPYYEDPQHEARQMGFTAL